MAVPTISSGTPVEAASGAEQQLFTFPMPSGTLAGDVFVINLTTNAEAITTVTKPATAVELMAMGGVVGGGVSGGLYWYEVPSVVPASIVFDWGTPRRGTLAWTRIRGGAPLLLHKSDMGSWAPSSVTSHTIPPLTTTEANCLLVAGTMVGSGSDTPTIAGTWTPQTDATQREGRIASRSLATAGATGAAAFATTAGYRSRTWQIAIVESNLGAGTVTVVAHQDDDLGILNPDIEDDIRAAGTTGKVVTAYITAGDNSLGWGTYAQGRESGIKAAYAHMASRTNAWTNGTSTLAGKTVAHSTLNGTAIRVYWLRLPDNATTAIKRLWTGEAATVATVDTSTTYTKAQLTSVLAAIIDAHAPARVRHMNHRDSFGGGDHMDHTAAGRFGDAAVAASTTKPIAHAYVNEQAFGLPVNVDATRKARKIATLNVYAAFDPNMAGWESDPPSFASMDRCYKVTPAAPVVPLPAASATLFGPALPTGTFPETDSSDPTTFATAFTVSAGATDMVALGARIFFPSASAAGVEGTGYFAILWRATSRGVMGEWVASGVFGSVVRNAWNSCTFEQPVRLASGETYYVSVFYPNGQPATKANFFAAASQISPQNARLVAPATATALQGMYRPDELAEEGWPPNADAAAMWWGVDIVTGEVSPGGGPTVDEVLATAQTEYMPGGFSDDIADTPAIWVDSSQPARSVVLGSRKAVTGGGIDVYDLAGRRLSFYGVGEVNNVMLRDLKGKAGWDDRILVVGTNRTSNTLAVAWLDRTTRALSAAGSVAVGFEPYGCALYISPVNGDIYAFVSEATGGAGGLKQFRLTLSGSTVSGAQVRSMPTASLAEGMAADDATQTFFLTEEAAGFYKYAAEPSGDTSRTAIDTVGAGRLAADVEGVAIAYGRTPGDDKIIVSSQGSSTFVVYNLAAPHAFVKAFRVVGDDGLIDDVTDTDGIAVTRADLGPQWPDGLFVAHDTTNPSSPASNFKFVDAGAILGSYRTPPTVITDTSTASLTAPVDRWVKGTMRPLWRGDDGIWRAILPTGSSGHRFYTLAPGGNVQGAVVDNRTGVRCTAVHHGGVTYVLRVRNASPAGLFAKYDSTMTKIGSDVTTGLSGITDNDAQPVSMLRSPNGYLWIAYTSSGAVRVQRSTDDGATWSSSSAVVTLAGVQGPVGLAMSGTTVVLVATDNGGLGRWVRTIAQGAATIAAGDWGTEAMVSLPAGITSDDHLSMIGLPDGRIILASKTTGSTSSVTPVLYSAIRSTSGTWTMQTIEAGPDETPPSYTRPVLTLVGGQVRLIYGSIYGHLDLSTRTTALDSLGVWSERGVLLVGQDYSDSGVLPPPESLVGLGSAPYPVLAHDKTTKQIVASWQTIASPGGAAGGKLGTEPVTGMFLNGAPVTGLFLGAVPVG